MSARADRLLSKVGCPALIALREYTVLEHLHLVSTSPTGNRRIGQTLLKAAPLRPETDRRGWLMSSRPPNIDHPVASLALLQEQAITIAWAIFNTRVLTSLPGGTTDLCGNSARRRHDLNKANCSISLHTHFNGACQ